MLLQNFLLSQAKTELSRKIKHVSKTPGAINRAVKQVTTYIDNIVLECEGVTTKDFLTKRKYEALETVLSYLVQEGYSQVKQDQISKKSGISKPIINYVFNWLQDLGVCQQIKVRRHGKIAPSIYILTIHNNYLKIIEYFKVKWAIAIDVCSTFTEILKKNLLKKAVVSEHEEKNIVSNGIDILNFEEQEGERAKANTNVQNSTDLHLNNYLSEDQKKAYHYIMCQPLTNLTEKDAYIIALRLPPNLDSMGTSAKWALEESVDWFNENKADISKPAHFMKMFNQKRNKYQERRNHEEKAILSNAPYDQTFKSKIPFYDWVTIKK
ncbi:Replicase RepFR55 [Bacillus pseudomycoides]|uniref:Replicase RepFR55 n=1 Tax=Bacillus pseudomycoides TaxID=64104 RepID=UPI000BED26D1|nr:Replicase RepFR55 [Bacillus pseudomycoides]PDZ10830.1 Replicase RepFR55 [Bacillus pseudomycoides]